MVVPPPLDATLSEALENTLLPVLPSLRRRREIASLISTMQNKVGYTFPEARVQPFGSTRSGLEFADSDVDVYVGGVIPTGSDWEERKTYVRRVAGRLRSAGNAFNVTDMLVHARVPVIKVKFYPPKRTLNEAAKELKDKITMEVLHERNTEEPLSVDVVVENQLGLHNSRLLQAYFAADPRLKKLGLLVKLWAKNRGVSNAVVGYLSSYAWTILVVHYLQHVPAHRGGPVLPPMDRIEPNINEMVPVYTSKGTHEVFVSYCGNPCKPLTETASLFSLLHGFFEFYAYFPWMEKEVALFAERPAEWGARPVLPRPDWRIQDPFEEAHNLATHARVGKHRATIVAELRRALELLNDKDVDVNTLKLLFERVVPREWELELELYERRRRFPGHQGERKRERRDDGPGNGADPERRRGGSSRGGARKDAGEEGAKAKVKAKTKAKEGKGSKNWSQRKPKKDGAEKSGARSPPAEAEAGAGTGKASEARKQRNNHKWSWKAKTTNKSGEKKSDGAAPPAAPPSPTSKGGDS